MRKTMCLIGLGLLFAATLTFTSGCNYNRPQAEKEKDKHDHPEKGPHGGYLAELPKVGEEEFHAELVVDKGKKEATVYILDGKAKDGVLIEADEIVLELQSEKPAVKVALKAMPEKEGDKKASRFVGTHEKLGGEIHPEKTEVSGIKIKGSEEMHATFEDKH